jgi:N-acetylglucosaminyl-diphospho-decaprenol L-rhamnosyltransferase
MSDGSPQGPATPAVDVVVVTRDTRELTLRCVESILAAGRAGEAEVVCTVVDNGSSDGTSQLLAERLPQARLIRNQQNVGYGAACNQGLAGGRGDIVLILNSDIYARPAAIGRLTGYLHRSGGHVAAGGRLVDPGTESVQVGHNVRAFPRLGPQLAQMVGLERRWPENPLSRRYLGLDLDYDRTQDVDQPAGSCFAVRRSDFDAVNGFDEGFYFWYEDVDLARRLRDRGPIAYVHDATFEHVGGATFSQWDRPEQILSWYPGLFRYFARHRPRSEQLALRAIAAGLCAVRALVNLPRHPARARACWRVVGMAVRGVPEGSGGRKTAGA